MVLWLLSTRHHRIIINKIRTRHEPNHSVVNFSISIFAANTFPSFLVCRPHPPSFLSLSPSLFLRPIFGRSNVMMPCACVAACVPFCFVSTKSGQKCDFLFLFRFFRLRSQMMPNFVFNLFISITRAPETTVSSSCLLIIFMRTVYVAVQRNGTQSHILSTFNQSINRTSKSDTISFLSMLLSSRFQSSFNRLKWRRHSRAGDRLLRNFYNS